MRAVQRLAVVALLLLLPLTAACRAIDSSEELQALAAEAPQERPAEVPDAAPAAPATGTESLDNFPLVGSPFSGLGGRLHSSLCDPASDPYSRCL